MPNGEQAKPAPIADELSEARAVLTTEYGMLMSALTAAWSASLTRTSLFLGVVSAAGVAAVSWSVAAVAFLVTLSLLFTYWHRSLLDMQTVLQPMFPTPTAEQDG